MADRTRGRIVVKNPLRPVDHPFIVAAVWLILLSGFMGLRVHPSSIEPDDDLLIKKGRAVYRIEPEPRGGEAFKLVYLIPAPVDAYWRFKTDFSGNFLLGNRYIKTHRLIYEADAYTITENSYTHAPGETFRWRTTRIRDRYRLEFRLENPNECGQRFHYGTIQLEPLGEYTKVTHIAYFDFFGAYIWVNLPFSSGMSAFLNYTAQWEIETFMRLRHRYQFE
jgi:hypothetical protein